MHPIAHAAAALLGAQAQRAEPLAGGSMGPVLRVSLSDGRRVIAKGGPDPAAEGAMLRAIRATGAPIYQLWPALVHLLLFGEGYRSMVERLLTEAGA